MPLCPQLVVPDMSKLQCIIPDTVCRRRQTAVLRVRSHPDLGGREILQARLSEDDSRLAAGTCCICIEALGGNEEFARISTQELWTGTSGGALRFNISKPGGLKYATLLKNEHDYSIMCGLGKMVVFSGDYPGHKIQACNGQGQPMARVNPVGDGVYEVIVYPQLDAGLILLGLLAIDKAEKLP